MKKGKSRVSGWMLTASLAAVFHGQAQAQLCDTMREVPCESPDTIAMLVAATTLIEKRCSAFDPARAGKYKAAANFTMTGFSKQELGKARKHPNYAAVMKKANSDFDKMSPAMIKASCEKFLKAG